MLAPKVNFFNFIFTFILIFSFLINQKLWADDTEIWDLIVNESLPVYKSASIRSKLITKLFPGDEVVVSPIKYRGFRKVMVTYQGQITSGYIPAKSITKSRVRQRRQYSSSESKASYHLSYGFGGGLVGSYLRQRENSFELSDGSQYSTTAFESFTPFFNIFFDLPINSNWGLRTYLNYRSTHYKGNAVQRNSPSPSPVNPTVENRQTLLGAGLQFKYYKNAFSWWWYGGGVELARGQKVEIKLNNVIVPTTDENLPFFAMLYLSTGMDLAIPFLNSFYFVPDLHLGVIATTKPETLYMEGMLAIAHGF
ncbi:MAG: hypothetical protein K1X29_08630 [Bdellovibrionales bacterium]|nr:hypothetical protein [Bdellovibrionales bacterium]